MNISVELYRDKNISIKIDATSLAQIVIMHCGEEVAKTRDMCSKDLDEMIRVLQFVRDSLKVVEDLE